MCFIACGVKFLVACCQGSGAGQQGVRPERGMLHDWPCQVVWGGVNGQLEQGVRVACVLFRNELPFLVKSLDVELFVGG